MPNLPVLLTALAATLLPLAAHAQDDDIPRDDWTITGRFQPGWEAALAINGDPATFWHTPFGEPGEASLTIDFGATYSITGLTVLPRPNEGGGNENGRFATFNIFVSLDNFDQDVTEVVLGGSFPNSPELQMVVFPMEVEAAQIRIVVLTAYGNCQDENCASAADINVFGVLVDEGDPPPPLPTACDDSLLLPRGGWTASATRFQPGYEPSLAINANTEDFWHTSFDDNGPAELTIDLGGTANIACISYLPRPPTGGGSQNGNFATMTVQTSNDGGATFMDAATGVTFPNTPAVKDVVFPGRDATHVKLIMLTAYGNCADEDCANAADVNVFGEQITTDPPAPAPVTPGPDDVTPGTIVDCPGRTRTTRVSGPPPTSLVVPLSQRDQYPDELYLPFSNRIALEYPDLENGGTYCFDEGSGIPLISQTGSVIFHNDGTCYLPPAKADGSPCCLLFAWQPNAAGNYYPNCSFKMPIGPDGNYLFFGEESGDEEANDWGPDPKPHFHWHINCSECALGSFVFSGETSYKTNSKTYTSEGCFPEFDCTLNNFSPNALEHGSTTLSPGEFYYDFVLDMGDGI